MFHTLKIPHNLVVDFDSIPSNHVLFVSLCLKQRMDRARSYETGIFKKPSDFLQMFKVLSLKCPVRR
jgi:sorting nexin-1/2